MQKVFLRRSSRILAGHLWIFSNELTVSPKNFEPGSLVEVYDQKNRFFGTGYINPHSLIAVRLLTKDQEEIEAPFFRRRIEAALRYRRRLWPDLDCGRVIYSEGDFLPGLIVDKYEDCLVVQFQTLGMEKFRETVLSVLDAVFDPSVVVVRNDSRARTLEGLPLEKTVAKGRLDRFPKIGEGENVFEVDPFAGQKTGFFLDQRENRLAFGRLVNGGTGLDLFCYSGAWGIHLARRGVHLKAVDESRAALVQAERNAALNQLTSRFEFVPEEAFQFLRNQVEIGALYDCIVLDPPAFVKSAAKVREALQGYREINVLAMKLLKRGGVMATCSCSYHIDRMAFLDMLRLAARDAGREARVLEYRSQGRDHPVLLSVPETEYLKCAFLAL